MDSVVEALTKGWHRDPSDRYEWRYWDGGWTNRVANSVAAAPPDSAPPNSADPVPTQTAFPNQTAFPTQTAFPMPDPVPPPAPVIYEPDPEPVADPHSTALRRPNRCSRCSGPSRRDVLRWRTINQHRRRLLRPTPSRSQPSRARARWPRCRDGSGRSPTSPSRITRRKRVWRSNRARTRTPS